jgi:hypothetical protein
VVAGGVDDCVGSDDGSPVGEAPGVGVGSAAVSSDWPKQPANNDRDATATRVAIIVVRRRMLTPSLENVRHSRLAPASADGNTFAAVIAN